MRQNTSLDEKPSRILSLYLCGSLVRGLPSPSGERRQRVFLYYCHNNKYKPDNQKQSETTRMKDQMQRGVRVKVPCKKHCSTASVALLSSPFPFLLLLLLPLLLLAPTTCVVAFAPASSMSARRTTGRAKVSKTIIMNMVAQEDAGERILVESDSSYNNESKSSSSSCQRRQPCDNDNDNHNNSRRRRSPTQSCLLGLASLSLATTLLVAHPLAAQAGFGPSSGATTSPPPGLSRPVVQEKDVETDNPKKLKIIIGSTLDERRLDAFNEQLDGLIESFQQRQEQQSQQGSLSVRPQGEQQAQPQDAQATTATELERIRLLQTQVRQREELLDKLAAQPYWFNYLAAFVGSVASTLVMHPIDTIKTRTMIGNKNDSGEQDDDDNVEPSLLDTVTSLYEGLTGNIFKEGPPSALYLGVYETVKYSLIPKTRPEALLLVYLTAGAAGEMVGSLVRAPAEAVKSVVQAEAAQTTWQAVQLCFGSAAGRQNVVRAWSASVLRDVPFGCLNLALFETVKAYILNNPDISIDSSTLLSEAVIGAFAGGCGALVTNPMDVVTTRIITQEAAASLPSENENADETPQQEALGVFGMTQKLYQEEGLSIFLKGWQARVGYWAPAISLFLTVYCSVRQAGVRYDIFG